MNTITIEIKHIDQFNNSEVIDVIGAAYLVVKCDLNQVDQRCNVVDILLFIGHVKVTVCQDHETS